METDNLQLLCIGGIPPSWGKGAAFPALLNLQLGSNALNGTLPPSFPPALQQLELGTSSGATYQTTGHLDCSCWTYLAMP